MELNLDRILLPNPSKILRYGVPDTRSRSLKSDVIVSKNGISGTVAYKL